MINVLIITGHFPPQQGAGANRPYSLFKYFKHHNINPFVITKKFNNTLVNEGNIYFAQSDINWRGNKSVIFSILVRAFSFLKFKFIDIYTDRLWLKSALKEAKIIINKEKIELIYVTFPGPEALLLGVKLSKLTHIPLISEFRDGLLFESLYRNQTMLQRWHICSLEKRVVQASAAIITIGNTLTTYFKNEYHLSTAYTVFNGFDEDDFIGLKPNFKINQNHTHKIIYHFGNLNSSRSTDRSGFFEAICYLKQHEIIDSNSVSIIFIGNFTKYEYDLAIKFDVEDIVKFKPSMPKLEGIKQMLSNGSALLFYGVKGEKSIISSKLPEYINMNLPILAICKGNEAESIIRTTNTGLVSDFDLMSIVAMFTNFIQKGYDYKPDKEVISTFNRKYQTAEVAQIIKNVLKKNE